MYTAPGCTLVPAKYRVDGGAKLIAGTLVDAAGIDPASPVLEVSRCSLFLTEADFDVIGLNLAGIRSQFIVHDFLTVGLSVRQDRTWRRIVIGRN